METASSGAALVRSGEGRAIWVLGSLLTYKVTAEQTGGAYSLFEGLVFPGQGVPPHIHHQEDECFYVLEGSFEFIVNGTRTVTEAGDSIYVPKGNLHGFGNVGGSPGRLLISQTPGGLHERFFEEVGEVAADRTNPPAMDEPPDVGRIVAIAAQRGTEFPPPPGV